MKNTLLVILLTAAAFVAAILTLAVNSRHKARITGLSACYAVVIGVICYGFAYGEAWGFSTTTVLRTLLTVCRMFGGVNDYNAIADMALFKSVVVLALFWLGHFLAFYVTASAAITVLGQRLLKYLQLQLLRAGKLTLVYGATPETVRLVKAPRGGRGLVFASEQNLAEAMNGVTVAAEPEALLRRIGFRRDRPVSVYCVSPDDFENLRWASALLEALRVRGVSSDNISLFLLGVPEAKAVKLLATEDRYGCGSLFACDRYALTARLAIRKLPPWTRVRFDAEGRARDDLRVVVVGFGRMGQAMLEQLVMNGQLEGSTFHAAVVDTRMNGLSGLIRSRFAAMLEAYDIQLLPEDARGSDFYELLERFSPGIIALCAGTRKENAELNQALERYYELHGDAPAIVQCAEDSVVLRDQLYQLEHIDVQSMDRLAMVLNHAYCNGKSPEDDWRTCDAFSRASCRASVDFYPAFLHMMGATDLVSLQKLWPPEGALLENLARTEHLRWCAFHLTTGYRPMSAEEFEARAARYRSGEKLRLGKNTADMTHACLVPWEALDDLSRRESAVTGKPQDYKQLDINNILALPEIMRREAEAN